MGSDSLDEGSAIGECTLAMRNVYAYWIQNESKKKVIDITLTHHIFEYFENKTQHTSHRLEL